jgi:hypothetical protein
MREMWRESPNVRLQQSRIAERLHALEPDNLDFAFRFALAQRAVAANYARGGDAAHARPRLFTAYQWSDRLTRRDPRNAEWLLFKGMVGCELYFRGLGLPAGVSRTWLRAEVISVAAILRAQNNPRVTEIARCVAALGGSQPH